jgi:hypothetical protein
MYKTSTPPKTTSQSLRSKDSLKINFPFSPQRAWMRPGGGVE